MKSSKSCEKLMAGSTRHDGIEREAIRAKD